MPGAKTIVAHTLERPPGLRPGRTVLDVGTGVRPMGWYKPERHVCLEPFAPYCEVLRAAGYEVIEAPAPDGLDVLRTLKREFDAVYLLDVIEHMGKANALRTLELACQLATVQVVVFTPRGYMLQTEDHWGYGGDYWQTHRSGWEPEDFPAGWTVSFLPQHHAQGSLLALWNAP